MFVPSRDSGRDDVVFACPGMDAVFVDDLRYSEAITPAEFAQRSFNQRLGERAANLLSRFL
jgi:hypothetical protein